jgi:NAD+ synthetase
MIKVASVQFNPVVGDVFGNAERMLQLYIEAAKTADLVVFPECSISGYPIEDLALKADFIDRCIEARKSFIDAVYLSKEKAGVIFGCPNLNTNGKTTNSAFAVDPVHQDYSIFDKQRLPNYGVFDEVRTFAPATKPQPTWQFRDLKIGILICEDAWHSGSLSGCIGEHFPNLMISINGSPFEIGKNVIRKNVIVDRIHELFEVGDAFGVPFVYTNMVGGQDEIVFDGNSFVIDKNGYRAVPTFEEGVHYFDVSLDSFQPGVYDVEPSSIADVYKCLVTGTRDFFGKQGFVSGVLGYSGGVDSGLVAAILVDAQGPKNANLVSLPSKFSDQASKDDALEGAIRLGANYRSISIEPIVQALRDAYKPSEYNPNSMSMMNGARKNTGTIFTTDPELSNYSGELTGVADENIQARARGNILMAISNQEGHMVLSTGNKSEVSLGFCTIYGDMSGGYNPIKDCPKTLVWALCLWRNQADPAEYGFLGPKGEVVPQEIIDKKPDAGLAENSKGDPFDYRNITDPILNILVDKAGSVQDVIDAGFDPAEAQRHYKLLLRSEYKRRQACPGIKITSKLHGRDRRIPIVYRE